MDTENLYSRIFYGASAFFAVLAVLYFGFEYIQNLSPFTISAVIFGVFASTLLIGVSRQNLGIKLVSYLISAGSYVVFLAYTNARLIDSSNGTLISLIASAAIFSGIGYFMTNMQDRIPNREQSLKIIGVIAVLIAALVVYDNVAAGFYFEYNFEDEIELQEGENIFGEVDIVKTGYIPVDVERERLSICEPGENFRTIGGVSIGGYTTGFVPETSTETLSFEVRPDQLNETDLEEGTYSLVKVESCRDTELEDNELGIEVSDNNRLYYLD